jgi:hypothetical protein
MVWRMSPYERRRGGNAPPGGLEVAPARVTPVPGKGALGTRWPRTSGTHQTQSWVTRGLHRGEGARQTPPRRGEGCASTAVSRAGGRPVLRNGVQSRGQNRTREIRPSGIEEGLQETWPVGALISTRRARLISISTTACTDRCGGGRKPDQSGQHVPRGPGASRRPYKNPGLTPRAIYLIQVRAGMLAVRAPPPAINTHCRSTSGGSDLGGGVFVGSLMDGMGRQP